MDSEQETQATAVSEGEQQPSNISENSAESAPDYNDLTVSKLKELLKELELPLSGKKSDLIERLQASNEKVTEESDNSKDKTKEPLVSFDKLDGLSRSWHPYWDFRRRSARHSTWSLWSSCWTWRNISLPL